MNGLENSRSKNRQKHKKPSIKLPHVKKKPQTPFSNYFNIGVNNFTPQNQSSIFSLHFLFLCEHNNQCNLTSISWKNCEQASKKTVSQYNSISLDCKKKASYKSRLRRWGRLLQIESLTIFKHSVYNIFGQHA